MSAIEGVESGIFPPELREALRNLLSQREEPYLDIPGTSDGPGLCISTSLAEFRRHIETRHQERLDSQPKVPANYRLGTGRRPLPHSRLVPQTRDASTQTGSRPEPLASQSPRSRSRLGTPYATQSAPETQARKTKNLRPPISRTICSSSTDTDVHSDPTPAPRSNPRQSVVNNQASAAASPVASSPCAWEKAVAEPVGPIYGPEDMIGRWVSRRNKRWIDRQSKKRKASGLPLPLPKRAATSASGKPDVSPEISNSDADDEDDEVLQSTAEPQDGGAGVDHAAPPPESSLLSSVPPDTASLHAVAAEQVVSSIEGVEKNVPVIPSSRDSASSQSGSDSQHQMAKIDKDARAALHQIEVAIGITVAHKHQKPMIEQSLALGGRDALENFRQACSCWRKDYASQTPQGLAAVPGSDKWHPALNRFSLAYHNAKDNTIRRAALDVLHRINLAYLYDVYLETLEELSSYSLQEKVSRPNGSSSRAQDVFDEDARDAAKNQMFWACYPDHKGKPRTSATGPDRTFRTMLTHAEKWHAFRDEFSIGMLALVPQGANTWYEKLPLKELPVYFLLLRSVNAAAVSMGETISARVFSSWRGDAPPERLLRLEHLENVDEIPFKTNPLRLLEEVNVGCTTGSSYVPERIQIGRAVTVPAGVDENNAAALNAVLSSRSQGEDKYLLPPGFYDGIDFTAV